ncbi:DUF5687 family protein [Daejeonella sp.]|uniref:DUF5687 family protein n=1 Tax=Daejeonella sp. TaxID=2805397 RepID=UPI0027B927F2|nr:DUF5687 family protein [Daejeonella sp.]
MTLTFIIHQYKAFWRSKNTGKSIAMRIVMGILILYLLLNVLVVAFFMDSILEKTYPNQEIIPSFNSLLMYYFLIDLLMRFQMQELPTLAVRPYLHLRINKNQLINYLSITSLGTAFNLSPLLLTLPFLIKVILPEHGPATFSAYILAITGLTLTNHFFSLWLKRKVNLNAMWMLLFFGTLILLVSLDFYFNLFSISALSAQIFKSLINAPLYCLLFLLLAGIIYLINYRYLKNNLYLEELHSADNSHKSSTEIPFLGKFGMAGDLAANELKLILRNKRPRSVTMMSLFFMFYGLIFYNKPDFSDYPIIFCGMFMTGIFIINYGQFMFSWQSAHFDGILVSKIKAKDFFRAKFLLFTMFSTISFLLTIPYVYFGWRVLAIHFIMLIWNLGVNTLLVLFFANRNYRRIDLSKGSAFNWEGVGASQWILSLPLLLGPFIIFLPFNLLDYPEAGIITIGLIGLLFIVTRAYWVNKLIEQFQEKRYTIAQGFRNE